MYTLLFLACQVSVGSEAAAPAAPAAQSAPPPAQSAAAQTPPSSAEVTMPPLSPSGPFLVWLAQQESTLLLPFEIELNPLGVQSAKLMGEPAVPFSLDTGAMGITLETRLQDPCPGEGVCKVWLQGRYGPLVAAGLAPSGHSFTVYDVGEAVDGTPSQARRE